MSYPRHLLSRNHKFVRYTGGDITLNVTAITDLHASFEIVLPAQTGDCIEVSFIGILSQVAQTKAFDVATYVGGVRQNLFANISTSLATGLGLAWVSSSFGANTSQVLGYGWRTLVSGDIDTGGTVMLRVVHAGTSTTSRLLRADTNNPAWFHAKNIGPVDPN